MLDDLLYLEINLLLLHLQFHLLFRYLLNAGDFLTLFDHLHQRAALAIQL